MARRIMTASVSNALIGIGAFMITFGGARAADAVVQQGVHPPGSGLLLISDAVLAAAFGIAVYLGLNLRATRTRLSDLERAQLVMDTQLSLAAQIQRHLLPRIPVESNGVRWAARLEPAYRVGGDFYDFLPGEGDSLFVVGDVSGKGVPAALLQASAHSLFRMFARETRDPAELLTRVSKEIYSENAGESYLTCLVVRINSVTRTLTSTNAGHPSGLMVGPSGGHILSRGGPPAGLFPETAYESEVLPIFPGDLGVIVSDGITEAIDEGDVAGVDEVLERAISAIPEPLTPERVCDALMEVARRGPGPRGVVNWQDDRTVFAFLLDVRVAAPIGG